MLDWNDLRYLMAVADRGSATAAARGLGVDKGTVSRRVAALEHALGARLFDRRASGWTVTEAGRRALKAARRCDSAATALQADLGGPGSVLRVPLRLTAPQWFCTEILLPRIGRLRTLADWVDLNLSARSKVADLAEREAEIGLRNLRPPLGEFVVRKVGELGSAIYASPDYLAARPPILTRDDFCREAFVAYPDRISYVPGFDWLNAAGLASVLRVDDAAAIAAALRARAGLGVIPCYLGDRDPQLRRVTAQSCHETIWLVAPVDVAKTLAVKRVLAFVAEAFAANAAALLG